ncbi:uncharacterized protein LOC121418049 [Lytechinus variegatus]|uniref:uncharacterized protein LOC121418049 n=1 Tax=Lytechinus variegatus TaxID=7654 RepID=UPI001BB25B47|nr:uncharacterized protein LOC121418049 [Lytechinus variegatus]
MEQTVQQPGALAAGVSVKLPPFWPDDPVLWFAQVEAQFSTRGITSEKTMYHYVVSSLQPEYAAAVRDLLVSPPSTNPYQVLKSELTKRTSVSEQKRLNQLLIAEELGDRSPTQLLRRMEQLLGGKELEVSIFRQLFLQRLPNQVQTVLAPCSDSMTITQLAEMADKIIEVSSPSTSGLPISNVTTSDPSPSTRSDPEEFKRLSSQVQQLTLQVQSLTKVLHQDRGRSSTRSSRRNRSRSRSRGNNPKGARQFDTHAGGECWYHWQFGKDAKKCSSPCSWQDKPHPSSTQGNAHASE